MASATSPSRRPRSSATAASQGIGWAQNTGRPPFELVPGTEEKHRPGLVLLAMGFLGPEQGLLDQLGVERDERWNAKAPRYATSVKACSPPATPAAASR